MEGLLQKLKRADAICREANVYYERANNMEQEAMYQKSMEKKACIICVIIGIIIFYIGGILGCLLGYIPVIGTALATVVSVVVIAAAVCVSVMEYRKRKVSIANKMQDIRHHAEEERAKAQKIFENHAEEVAFLPINYWYPMATEYLIKLVESQRADSLKEALNLYDEQLHRWKIEQANSQMLTLQQQQTNHLASIKTSSKISAAANVTNTLFNIASKL